MTMILPERDRDHVKRRQFLAKICVLMAGRIAEEMFCDDITAGAQNDLERATEIARSMVCRWGMSEELGPVSYNDEEDTVFLGREITRHRTHSETLAMKIDEEIRKLITESYDKAQALLQEHTDPLRKITEALLKYEVLRGDEVADIIAGKEVTKEPPPERAKPEAKEAEPKPHEPEPHPRLEGQPAPTPAD